MWWLNAAMLTSAGRGFTEHVPLATRNKPLLDNEVVKTSLASTKTGSKALPPKFIHGIVRNGDKNTILESLEAVISIGSHKASSHRAMNE
jgi:hypothetical protein